MRGSLLSHLTIPLNSSAVGLVLFGLLATGTGVSVGATGGASVAVGIGIRVGDDDGDPQATKITALAATITALARCGIGILDRVTLGLLSPVYSTTAAEFAKFVASAPHLGGV